MEVAGNELASRERESVCVMFVIWGPLLQSSSLLRLDGLVVMAMFACSIVIDGSDDERGPAGSGSSALRPGKTVM